MKTLILGMGNPILSDDGIGIWVARALEGELSGGEVTVMETSMAGLNLLELMADYDRAILIDAIKTGKGEVRFIDLSLRCLMTPDTLFLLMGWAFLRLLSWAAGSAYLYPERSSSLL